MAVVILVFNEVAGHSDSLGAIRGLAIAGLLVNIPYALAARTAIKLRAQAYLRMQGDVALVTLGLYFAGGIAASGYLSIYAPIPLFAGLSLSSAASLVAAATATAAYLIMALAQELQWLPTSRSPSPNAWTMAAFSLLVLNVIGVLTAILARAYRRSRSDLARSHDELQRAHEESLRLNAELQRAGRLQLLGEVVAGVIHEISNALQAAMTQAELAAKKAAGRDSALTHHLEHIAASCSAAMRIARNALDTARAVADQTVPVSLAAVASRIADLKRYDLRRDRIDMIVDFPEEFPRVAGRPAQFDQILLNLVTNAQQALQGHLGPRVIEIVGMVRDEDVVVEVRDSGPGIPPEDLPRLFEPFFTTKPQGTGLGLAISRGIVRELGGQMGVVDDVGQGAVFQIVLPAHQTKLPRLG